MMNNQQQEQPQRREKGDMHPIWRGIGFAIIVLSPILGWAAAILLFEANWQNKWVAIPRDLIVEYKDPYILIKLILAAFIAFLIYIIFQLITFFLYKLFAPSRYGPMDVPSVNYKGKRYKR